MSKETKSKRFISIRLRLFLQVGAIVLIAVMLILALNKWYLSSIYILNQKRTMQYLAEEIDTYDVSAADYSHLFPKEYGCIRFFTGSIHQVDSGEVFVGGKYVD